MVASAINSAQPSSTNSSTTTKLGSDIVNREDFLKLLVAQLQNQDPLNPMENQEFVAELATFSSLEQLTNHTDLLQELVDGQSSNSTTQALSLIGKTVTMAESDFQFEKGNDVNFEIAVDRAGTVAVKVTNEAGETVYTDTVTAAEAGRYSYTLDGSASLASGSYTIAAGIPAEDGTVSELPIVRLGAVEGVTFQDGSPLLIVDGQPISLASVETIYN
ncbi:MAG: flagellar hook assembly protein FlgD [Candidatus Omnitrophota bacterium]